MKQNTNTEPIEIDLDQLPAGCASSVAGFAMVCILIILMALISK